MPTELLQHIVLIASGRTDWQDAGRVQGATDLPLSAEGLRIVADRAAHFTPERAIHTIHCAPDEASRHTAEVFAERMDDARIRKVDNLHEMNLGLWQGLTETQLAERFPTPWNQWRSDPTSASPPQSESLDAAADRLIAAVARLVPRSPEDSLALVLRPLALAICSAWLVGDPIGPRLLRNDLPPIQTLRLNAESIRTIRAGRRRKSLRAASTRV